MSKNDKYLRMESINTHIYKLREKNLRKAKCSEVFGFENKLMAS